MTFRAISFTIPPSWILDRTTKSDRVLVGSPDHVSFASVEFVWMSKPIDPESETKVEDYIWQSMLDRVPVAERQATTIRVGSVTRRAIRWSRTVKGKSGVQTSAMVPMQDGDYSLNIWQHDSSSDADAARVLGSVSGLAPALEP